VGRTAVLLVVALGLLRDPCGGSGSPTGLNSACTRTTDCDNGLECIEGQCTAPDSGVVPTDARGDVMDAGGPDGSAAD
jgi:hypothetical protein